MHDAAQQTVYFSNTVVTPDSKYEYDALYRLIRADGREHPNHGATKVDETDSPVLALPHPNNTAALRRYTEEYEYDSVGNILEMAHTAGTDSWTRWYQYAELSNKLTGTSDGTDTLGVPYDDTTSYTDHYTHDARGNMTSMPHLAAMDWDFGDRLQHCDLGGGGDSYFVYDAAGNRVRKVWVKTSSLIEERIYVGGYEVWRKHLSGVLDEEKQTLHVMDDQRRIAMVETKTVASGSAVSSPTSYLRYQLDDHLGSSRVECDGSGALLTYEEYHPYGTTAFRASSGASGFAAKRYRYTGKERDEETGLYYYGARYYPPWLARWTAVDPSLKDGFNRYEYVRGNPITFNDPDGRQVAEVPKDLQPGQSLADYEHKKAMVDFRRREAAWVAKGEGLVGKYKSELEAINAGGGSEEEKAARRAELGVRAGEEQKAWTAMKPIAPKAPDIPEPEQVTLAEQFGDYLKSKGVKSEDIDAAHIIIAAHGGEIAEAAEIGLGAAGRAVFGRAPAAEAPKSPVGGGTNTAVSGARTAPLRADEWDKAEAAYDTIRTTDDVGQIATNTGLRETWIARIKNHLFTRTHELDDGLIKRFDADPFIANAWRRLQAGTHTPNDIALLKHELFESKFEGIFKMDYRTSHSAAVRAGRTWEPLP